MKHTPFKAQIVYVLNALYRRTPYCRKLNDDGIGKFLRLKNYSLKLVVLGSDEALYDYRQEDFGNDFCNWALKSQSLEYGFSILKNYFSYLSPGAVVMLSISPISIFDSIETGGLNDRYYTILHPATIFNFDNEKRTKEYLFNDNPVGTYPLKCVRNIINDIFSKFCCSLNKTPLYPICVDCIFSAGKILKQYQNANLTHKCSVEDKVKTRQDLIHQISVFCRDRGLKLLVVIPPFYKNLRKRIDSVMNIDRLVPADVMTLNYYDDISFVDSKLYASATILNAKGAGIFRSKLIADLERIGLIKSKK